MSQRQFLQQEAKTRAVAAIKEIELATSAEIVVSVRTRSADYRLAAYQLGISAMVVVVLALLIVPWTFPLESILLHGLSAFLAMTLVAHLVPPLLRRFVRKATREQNSQTLAHALFYEQGVSRTSGRNGILVFVSLFERQCVVVPDIGIDEAQLGEKWLEVKSALSAAVARTDLDAFFEAMRRMGPILGEAMPRMEDDVNELSDEVC
ncbi:MAG: hypothetical protein IKC51_06115 [Myxococcaceae bacterium]|nr:hypothetical protein [Myxococcaceae bacterium]